jgi:hypothetical protein
LFKNAEIPSKIMKRRRGGGAKFGEKIVGKMEKIRRKPLEILKRC